MSPVRGTWNEELDRFFASFPTQGAHRTLELGCGNGVASLTVHQLLMARFDHPDSRLVCVDIDLAAVAETRLGLVAAGLDRCHCIQADLDHMPLQSGWFDSVVALNLIHIVPPRRVARAAHQALGTAGRLFARNYSPQLAIPQFSLILDRHQVAALSQAGD